MNFADIIPSSWYNTSEELENMLDNSLVMVENKSDKSYPNNLVFHLEYDKLIVEYKNNSVEYDYDDIDLF